MPEVLEVGIMSAACMPDPSPLSAHILATSARAVAVRASVRSNDEAPRNAQKRKRVQPLLQGPSSHGNGSNSLLERVRESSEQTEGSVLAALLKAPTRESRSATN